jgi:hypothetical protein
MCPCPPLPSLPLVLAVVGAFGLISGTAGALEITSHPSSQILPLGGSLTLSTAVEAEGGVKFQWQRNNANIPGATAQELQIEGLTLARAGAYRCKVSTLIGGKTVSALTSEAQVAVVDTASKNLTLAAGTKVTLTASAAGTGLSYQWRIGAEAIPGATGKTLALANLKTSDTGIYSCAVTAPGGSLASGGFVVTVYDEPPVIALTDGDLISAAIVSGDYTYAIPVNAASVKAPATFAASGLPPGLKIDKSTGVISGKPTASKAVPYDVTLTAANARGKHSVKVKLPVAALDPNLIGTYMAPLSRFTDLNDNLGGRLDLTTTTRGTFSGKLLLGAGTYPFTGSLDADVANPLSATGETTVKRGKLPPLTLTFTLDAESNWISLGEITDGTAKLEFSGWRNPWTKANPAAALAGYYTFGLAMPEGASEDEGLPQGDGYGAFTIVANTGALKMAGKLPDGTAFTNASFAGPGGEIAYYQTLYPAASRGSLTGTLFVGLADPSADNDVYGALSWYYPGSTAKSARTYAGGIGPLDLMLQGAVYTSPVAPKVALGLTEGGTLNGTLSFIGPFSDIPAPEPALGLTIGAKSKVILPAAASNPRKTTLTLNAATGIFSGGFTLTDPDLLSVGKTITRKGSFAGIIVRDPLSGTQSGRGYFLLPQRPQAAGETAATTPILSGQTLLLPAVE